MLNSTPSAPVASLHFALDSGSRLIGLGRGEPALLKARALTRKYRNGGLATTVKFSENATGPYRKVPPSWMS